MEATELKRCVDEIMKRLLAGETVIHNELSLVSSYIEMLEYKQDRYEKAIDLTSERIRELRVEMSEVGLAH